MISNLLIQGIVGGYQTPFRNKLAAHLPALLGWVEAEPDNTMPDLSAKLACPTVPISIRSKWPSPNGRPLCRIGARTIDALWKAIDDISAHYSEQDAGTSKHAGQASH